MELAQKDYEEYQAAKQLIRDNLATFVQVGLAMKKVRDHRWYLSDGITSFDAFLRTTYGPGYDHIYAMMRNAEVVGNLISAGYEPKRIPAKEKHVKLLQWLSKEAQVKVWDEAQRIAAERHRKEPSIDDIKAAKVKLLSDASTPATLPTENEVPCLEWSEVHRFTSEFLAHENDGPRLHRVVATFHEEGDPLPWVITLDEGVKPLGSAANIGDAKRLASRIVAERMTVVKG